MDAIKSLLAKASKHKVIQQVQAGLVCEEAQRCITARFGAGVVGDISSISHVGGVLTIKTSSSPLKQRLKYCVDEIIQSCNAKFGQNCVTMVRFR